MDKLEYEKKIKAINEIPWNIQALMDTIKKATEVLIDKHPVNKLRQN